jgi:NO-binding membrane sensor protein with MHYT domain
MKRLQYSWKVDYIVLSFVVSFIGWIVGLELIHLRSGVQGTKNRACLVAGCFVMGLVSVFSMHFIGMMSLTIGEVSDVGYNAYMTIASVLFSTLGMYGAFELMGVGENLTNKRLLMASLSATVGIASMHHLGVVSLPCIIALRFAIEYYVAAAAICVSLHFVAFKKFFQRRQKWQLFWWVKTGLAAVLSVAVCATHYVATLAITYSINMNLIPAGEKMSDEELQAHYEWVIARADGIRQLAFIVIFMVAGVCCIALLIGAWRMVKAKRKETSILEMVSLGALYFNSTGQVLVTQSGSLPMVPILKEYDVHGKKPLTGRTGVFQWLLKMSFNWDIVMEHWYQLYSMANRVILPNEPLPEMNPEYFFCAKFMDALTHLSEFTTAGFDKSGELLQDVYTTLGPSGQGQLLILSRVLSKAQVFNLANKPFQWMDQDRLTEAMSESIPAIPKALRDATLLCQESPRLQETLSPGTYAVVVITERTKDETAILVASENRFMCPHVMLSPFPFKDIPLHIKNKLAAALTDPSLTLDRFVNAVKDEPVLDEAVRQNLVALVTTLKQKSATFLQAAIFHQPYNPKLANSFSHLHVSLTHTKDSLKHYDFASSTNTPNLSLTSPTRPISTRRSNLCL